MIIQRQDIERGLRRMSLGDGDIVLLHSALSSLGRVDGGADAVIDAFLDVIGPDGTLVVPTFGALGIITETLKQRPQAVRSIHPKASVAAIGAAAEAICRDHWKADMAHGQDTPYTRIADMGGYVCLLGVDQDRNTTLHTVEELLRLPYLKETLPVTFTTPEGEVTRSWTHFPGPHRDFIGLDRRLQDRGVLRVGRIGQAVVRLMRSADLLETAMQIGQDDPAFVLCNNPACNDCVLQRADVTRGRFAGESFTMAAHTSLAGTYTEEIADCCHKAGVQAVEIDLVRGLPLTRVPADVLSRTLDCLRRENLEVLALRVASLGDAIDRFVAIAAAEGVPRVVAPLSEEAPRQAAAAAEKGIQLAFFNHCMDAATSRRLMEQIAERGIPARLALSPAACVEAGENPFLTSYRRGLAKYMDQLDVEDLCFNRTAAALACGNAEIKELISILRCRNFSGTLLLSGRNRQVADLKQTVQACLSLLEHM